MEEKTDKGKGKDKEETIMKKMTTLPFPMPWVTKV
jgi:hypothetical protein